MKRIFPFLALWLLSGIYIAAGAVKVADPLGFARNILDYRLAPELLAPLVAVVLPWWEVLAGGLAIAGWRRRGALAVLTGLSAAFAVIGAVTLMRGLSPACGCFGMASERVGAASLGLELLLTLVGVLLLWRERRVATAT